MKRVQVGVGSIRLTRPSPTTSSCSKMFVLMVSLSVERASYCVLARHRGCSSRSSACWGVGCQLRRCSCSVQCVHASACRLRGGMLLAAGAADAVQSMLLSGLLLAVGTGSLANSGGMCRVWCACAVVWCCTRRTLLFVTVSAGNVPSGASFGSRETFSALGWSTGSGRRAGEPPLRCSSAAACDVRATKFWLFRGSIVLRAPVHTAARHRTSSSVT